MLLSQPKGKGLSPETAPSTVNAPCGVGSAVLQSQDCGDPTRATRRAGAVSAAAQILGRAGARRKVLFWITPDMGASPLDPDGNRRAQRQALVQAVNNDVAVYAVDPRENITGVETENDGRPDRRTGGTYRVGPGDAPLLGSSAGGGVLSLDTDDMVAVPLTQLARETGGRFITAANDLETVLADIVEQNTTSYLVVYETSVSQTAGRHRIQLAVNRPGARVFARRGYVVDRAEASVAERPSQSAQAALLTKTLMGSVPQGRVPLTMQVTPQFADGKQGQAGVTVAIGPLPAASIPVDLLIVSVDERGNTANQQQLRVPSPPPGEPWEITTEVPLSKGHHQLRVAAATADGAHTGLVLAAVEIVEPGRNLVMTPPVLLESSTGIVRPTAVRTRQPGAPLALQVQVAGRPVEQKSVRVHASLIDAAGRSVREADAILDPGAKPDRARATAVLDTDDVPAGQYLLLVEAGAPGRASGVRHGLPITLESRAAASPAGPPEGGTAGQPRDASTMAIGTSLLAHGPTSSHVAAPLVIRTEIAFAEFWKGLPTRQLPPPVDFERVALLAIVIETPAAAPRRPVVARVERGEDGVIAYWTTAPAEAHADLAPQTALRPFVVVAVTGAVERVRFERVE
jgi:hypothetical protein